MAGHAPPKQSRFLRIINSGLFLLVVGAILSAIASFIVFYYHTYTQCVADARDLYTGYISLEMELFQRQNEIAGQVLQSKSISDLRKAIDARKYIDAQYKELTTAQLETLYLTRSELIDERGINKSAEIEFMNSKLYQRFNPVLFGNISETISDADLKDLQEFTAQFVVLQLVRMSTRLRSNAEIACIPANVFQIMLGEKPVTIQRYDTGSFVEKERSRLRAMSKRNLLPPRTPPNPFPDTTFKPDVPPAQAR